MEFKELQRKLTAWDNAHSKALETCTTKRK